MLPLDWSLFMGLRMTFDFRAQGSYPGDEKSRIEWFDIG